MYCVMRASVPSVYRRIATSGEFGIVYKGRVGNQDVAMKTLKG